MFAKAYILGKILIFYVLVLLLHLLVHLEENTLTELLDLLVKALLHIVYNRVDVEDLINPSFQLDVGLRSAIFDVLSLVI